MRVIGFNLCFLLLALALFIFATQQVHGQNFGVSTEATLRVVPSSPAPNSDVVVSLDAYSLDTTGATITWYVNGNRISQAQNERSIEVSTGELGEAQTVTALVAPPQSPSIEVISTITPSVVDIIIEADTYTPTFYKGRALPGAGAPIRATAIPFVGEGSNPAGYTYEWKLGTDVLLGGPVRGKHSIELDMPKYSEKELSVTVTNSSGSFVGSGRVTLENFPPELLFYQENPLRGIKQTALIEDLTLDASEVTLRAVPYYLNEASVGADTTEQEWQLDGEQVAGSSVDPYLITFRRTGERGSGNVEFSVADTELLEFAEGAFTISFE